MSSLSIEGSEERPTPLEEENVAARQVASVRAVGEYADRSVIAGQEADTSQLVAPSPDREDDPPRTGKHLRPAMTLFLLAGSGIVRTSGSPPVASICDRPFPPVWLWKTMKPSSPQEPPQLRTRSSARTVTGPPPIEATFKSLSLRAKKPTRDPSGEKKGNSPRSVPGMGSDVSRSRRLSCRARRASIGATATMRPSRERANECTPPAASGSGSTKRRTVARLDSTTSAPRGQRPAVSNPEISPAATHATREAAMRARAGRRGRGGAVPASSTFPASISSISKAASPISRMRRWTSFSRQRRSRRTTGGGTSLGTSCHSGSSLRRLASVSEIESPPNGGRPTRASKRQQPNAQMSLRLSTLRPVACSGLI